MAAVATNLDGDYIFLALEKNSLPMVYIAERSDLDTWYRAYDPNAGTAVNVIPTGDTDKMLFYGNFGTNIVLISHTISTGTNTDISPSSLGANVVNTCAVDPASTDRIVITVNTNEDIMYTDDGGTSWSTWDATLGFDATALDVLWSSLYDAHRYFVAGDNGVDLDVLYSPNEGSSDSNQENATLGALTNITNLETVKAE